METRATNPTQIPLPKAFPEHVHMVLEHLALNSESQTEMHQLVENKTLLPTVFVMLLLVWERVPDFTPCHFLFGDVWGTVKTVMFGFCGCPGQFPMFSEPSKPSTVIFSSWEWIPHLSKPPKPPKPSFLMSLDLHIPLAVSGSLVAAFCFATMGGSGSASCSGTHESVLCVPLCSTGDCRVESIDCQQCEDSIIVRVGQVGGFFRRAGR